MVRSASPSSARPVYLRLRDLIAAEIMDGAFAEGEMLPSVRAFAAEQGANPLTVAKAYQTFQDDGYVTVRRGVGMFLLPGAVERLRMAERERFLTGQWPRIREHIVLLGLDMEKLMGPEIA